MSVPTFADPYRFLDEQVHPLLGWLEDYTALRTMDLLTWQESAGVAGPLFEIGVYGGRYFSVLYRSAIRNGDQIVGLDTFQWIPEDRVRASLEPLAAAGTRATFIAKPSTDCSAGELLGALGAEPRFISVDGSHECDDVFWDLRLCEEILAPKGIVAVDDFLNPVTLGVNDAVNRFFATPRNLAPFAYVANKLFLSRPSMVAEYMKTLEAVVVADQREPRSATFREQAAKWRGWVEQKMWGRTFLVIP